MTFVPRRSGLFVRMPAALSLALLVGCGTPLTRDFEPDNARIVEVHAKNAFDVFFGAADRPAFAAFVQGTQQAASRSDLTAAWGAVPVLVAQGEDFLERRVFAKAIADGGWKAPVEPERNEAAFVQGTRAAATATAEQPQ